MSRAEIVEAIQAVAKVKTQGIADFDLVAAFVSGLMSGFTAATDHPTFKGVHIENYMIEAVTGNVLANAKIIHTIQDIELMVAGAVLMIGTIQLHDYMQAHDELDKGETHGR